jgi:anti-sigma regulatory factor (Ser/Thr protein kinase)
MIDRLDGAGAHPDVFSCELSSSAAAVPEFRRMVRDVAALWDLPSDTEYALMLIVSELATNACLHSGSADVRLLLRNGPHTVDVEVADNGRWKTASSGTSSQPGTNGRGLQIAHAYAEAFTLHRNADGTRAVAHVAKAASHHEYAN